MQMMALLLLPVFTAAGGGVSFSLARTHPPETLVSATTGLTYTVESKMYQSPPLLLAPGGVIFTDPHETRLEMPTEGDYAILSFKGEVVDAIGKSVPLDTVYDHHWIAQHFVHENELCPKIKYVFGIGAESRNDPVDFPTGFGYIVKQNANEWGGNIHVLRTEGLAHDAPGMVAVHDIVGGASADAQAAKQCNECFYAVGKGPKCFPSENGTFNCCGDNCFDGSCKCPTTANATEMGEISYSLSYTIKYTLDVAAVKPLLTGVLATPDCAQFYAVEPGAPGEDSETVHESITSFTVPSATSILLALGHQHTGAINISLFINNKFTCASIPTYGNETGVAGNEKDHLVAMSTCYEHDPADATRPPLALVEGDKITVKAYYYVGEDDTRLSKGLGGIHLNVMSYMYLAYTDPLKSSKAKRPPHLLLILGITVGGVVFVVVAIAVVGAVACSLKKTIGLRKQSRRASTITTMESLGNAPLILNMDGTTAPSADFDLL